MTSLLLKKMKAATAAVALALI